VPCTRKASLPLRFELLSNGDTGFSNISCIGSSFLGEPEFNYLHTNVISNSNGTPISISGFTNILAIRLKQTFRYNRLLAILSGINVLNDNPSRGFIVNILIGNGSGSGSRSIILDSPTWNSVDNINQSALECSISGNSYTNGILLFEGFGGFGNNLSIDFHNGTFLNSPSNYYLSSNIIGQTDIILISIKALTGVSNVYCSVTVDEQIS
jgi:hypothetical protein